MARLAPRLLTGIAALGLLGLGGCKSSTWSASGANGSSQAPAAVASSPPVASAASAPTATVPAAATAPQSPTPQSLLEIAQELQQIGTIDPAGQERLLADLKQTDPSLWPLMIQQVRATVAYRKRAAERDAMAGNAAPTVTAGFSAGAPAVPAPVQRLPSPNDAAPPPAATPQDSYPRTAYPAADPKSVYRAAKAGTGQTESSVVAAAYHAPAADKPAANKPTATEIAAAGAAAGESANSQNWREALATAIQTLEQQTPQSAQSPEDAARHAQLRILHLLAGRRDAALRPIPSAAPAMQEFWAKSLYGLDMMLDPARNPDATRRAAEAKRAWEEAADRLGETAPLVVRNLAFCTEIQSYGCYKPFRTAEFTPEQELLLYAEVENFVSEATAKGYHTALRSSYQIFDARGQRVADHDFTVTEEHCQNPRRDFFIGYHLRLPRRIYAGKHTLQLTIEDLKSHKAGQSTIEFTLREPKER